MHAERAFSAGLDRGNDKLRFLSAQLSGDDSDSGGTGATRARAPHVDRQ